MPFRQGALSIRRYVVQDEVPATLARTATMAVRRWSYRPIDAQRGEREAFGWVNPRRLLDETFTWEDLQYSNTVLLAVRRDRKSFNKALFRARRDDLFEKTRKDKGLERLTRQHRLALEEQLTVEMLAEVTPTTSFVELLWDLNTNEVYLSATAKALCERIVDLFVATFDLRLAPTFPALAGYRWIAEQGLEENYDAAGTARGGKGGSGDE